LKNNRDRKGEWKNEIYIRKDVDKRSCKSEKSKEDRLLVDSGAIYTVVPAEDLQEQGIAAHSAREFELADGAVIKRKVGNAYFEDEIRAILPSIQDEIQSRLQEFDSVLKTGDEESIFAELVFCILTPQSKAKSAWAAVERLLDKGSVFLIRVYCLPGPRIRFSGNYMGYGSSIRRQDISSKHETGS
jgi:hypothetical protein